MSRGRLSTVWRVAITLAVAGLITLSSANIIRAALTLRSSQVLAEQAHARGGPSRSVRLRSLDLDRAEAPLIFVGYVGHVAFYCGIALLCLWPAVANSGPPQSASVSEHDSGQYAGASSDHRAPTPQELLRESAQGLTRSRPSRAVWAGMAVVAVALAVRLLAVIGTYTFKTRNLEMMAGMLSSDQPGPWPALKRGAYYSNAVARCWFFLVGSVSWCMFCCGVAATVIAARIASRGVDGRGDKHVTRRTPALNRASSDG